MHVGPDSSTEPGAIRYRGAWFIESWLKFDGESRPSDFRWRFSHELQTVLGGGDAACRLQAVVKSVYQYAHAWALFPWRVASFHSGCVGVGKRGAAAGQKASEVPCNFSHLVRTNAFTQVILLGMYCK